MLFLSRVNSNTKFHISVVFTIPHSILYMVFALRKYNFVLKHVNISKFISSIKNMQCTSFAFEAAVMSMHNKQNPQHLNQVNKSYEIYRQKSKVLKSN